MSNVATNTEKIANGIEVSAEEAREVVLNLLSGLQSCIKQIGELEWSLSDATSYDDARARLREAIFSSLSTFPSHQDIDLDGYLAELQQVRSDIDQRVDLAANAAGLARFAFKVFDAVG